MSLVDIVLTTFNGEKYLEEQLNSLLNQTYPHWRLIISDDGSTDETVRLLRRYEKLDDRIGIVNIVRQGGVVRNFYKALCFSTSDYVMFCDQDDIWLPDKVASMVNAIRSAELALGNQTPLLGFSDLSLVDETGMVIHESFYRFNRLEPRNNMDIRYLSWRSAVYGCTVIFNKALLKKAMPMPFDIPMHDHWFALVAAKCGKIFYCPESNIYYRQHRDNVIGGAGGSFVEKLCSLRKLLSNTKNAAKKCKLQWRYMTKLSADASENRHFICVDTFAQRISFIRMNVLPYWRERKVYAFLFGISMLLF